MRMPFGKFTGMNVADLPDDYLEWLRGRDLREPLKAAVFTEFAARRPKATRRASVAHDPALAKQLIDVGFRSLAKKFHPDAGGDLRAMQNLNSTVDWLREKLAVLAF